jgi:hypothetical protein
MKKTGIGSPQENQMSFIKIFCEILLRGCPDNDQTIGNIFQILVHFLQCLPVFGIRQCFLTVISFTSGITF